MRRHFVRTAALAFVGIVFFVVGARSVSAVTVVELQAQVQALLAQLAALQNQAQTIQYIKSADDFNPLPVSQSCPHLTLTMQRGSRDVTTNSQVTNLQIWLANYFSLNEEDIVSGYFGKTTERYVQLFQRQNNLPTYGIVGSLTRAKIAQVCGTNSVSVYPIGASVDIKVNGSDGPTSIVPGAFAAISWTTQGVTDCQIANAQIVTQGGYVAPTGMQYANLNGGSVILTCYGGGQVISDQVDSSSTVEESVSNPPRIEISPRRNGQLVEEVYEGDTIPVTWNASNVPANTKVVLWFSVFSGSGQVGGVFGNDWNSAKLSVGSSSGNYEYQTAISGVYEVKAFLVPCDYRGCDFNPFADVLPNIERIAIAKSEPFRLNVNSRRSSPSVTVITPSGGETFVGGGYFSTTLRVIGRYPIGTKVCINLTNQSNQYNYAPFDGDGHCVWFDTSKDVQDAVIAGNIRTAFDPPRGVFKVRAFFDFTSSVYQPEFDVQTESVGNFTIL